MQDSNVYIPDAELKKAICQILNKDISDDVTIEDMEGIKVLSFWANNPVMTFQGLQYAKNLMSLSVGLAGYNGVNIDFLPTGLLSLELRINGYVDFTGIAKLKSLLKFSLVDVSASADFNEFKGISNDLMYFYYASDKKESDQKRSLDFIKPLNNITEINLTRCNMLDSNGIKLYRGVIDNISEELTFTASDTNITDISEFESKTMSGFQINSHLEVVDPLLGDTDTYRYKNIFISVDGPIDTLGIIPSGYYDSETGFVNFTNVLNETLAAFSVEKVIGNKSFYADLFIKKQ